jgi:hypothetical protein
MNQRTKGSGTYTKNTIGLHQKVRIMDMMRARADHYRETQPTLEAVAAEMAKEIGAAVSPQTISALRIACGVQWKAPRNLAGGVSVKARLRVLERTVQTLCDKLGEPLPPEWDTMTANDNGKPR